MTGVRWRPDTGFEGKCDRCLEWWPLDRTCWFPDHGMKRCRACLSEIQSQKNKLRRLDPEKRKADVEAMRAFRRANAEHVQEQRKAYYRAHRERINELARLRYAERAAEGRRREYKRDWMRAFRERQRELKDAA